MFRVVGGVRVYDSRLSSSGLDSDELEGVGCESREVSDADAEEQLDVGEPNEPAVLATSLTMSLATMSSAACSARAL